jgi:hypothetical protein
VSNAVQEVEGSYVSGWLALPLWLAAFGWTLWSIYLPLAYHRGPPSLVAILALPLLALLAKGFLILQPNIAAVLVFFGRYVGTVRADGFFWVNPFNTRQRISLRAHNLNTPTLKVNDRAGNPVEVAAVVVWRVQDTARAVFDVEEYQAFIHIQSESALRQVVSGRWYDGDANGQHSLRGDLEAVAQVLMECIQEHASLAGLEVVEARIAHLAYAAEIASAMLRRQQAEAVVAARAYIVEGAVGMVKLGIEQLQERGVVTLSDADRVRLVTNLMTVLVSDNETQPVLPLGRE